MRVAMLVLLVGTGFAQAAEEATRLIQQVAQRANDAQGWSIEGSVRYPKSDVHQDSPDQFSLMMRYPGRTRFEQTGTRSPALIVCDGYSSWIYSPPLRRYRKESSIDSELCSPIVQEWKMLATRLHSPVVGGSCGSDPSTKSADFTLVRGLSEPQLASTGTIKRTLCIDADRRLIVWDKWEVRHSSVVYIYSRVEAKAGFPADTFAFEPPPGTTLTDLELPTPRPLGTRGIAQGPDISAPRLMAHPAPQYGQASREAGIQGAVVLYVVIGIDGTPSEVLVYQHLSPDLDDEAVRTVRQWRFTPGKRNGQAVALSVTIEVNFRLG